MTVNWLLIQACIHIFNWSPIIIYQYFKINSVNDRYILDVLDSNMLSNDYSLMGIQLSQNSNKQIKFKSS